MQIRELGDADWPQVFPIFDAIVAAGETYAYPEHLTSEQARALWTAAPPGHTVVAVDGDGGPDVVLGTARCSPNRDGRGAHVATASFMVDPAAAGRGVGRALGEWVVARCAADGYRGIQFNAVVETNTAAVHLWQRLGFRIVGTVPGAFRHRTLGFVGLHVMYLDLRGPHAGSA